MADDLYRQDNISGYCVDETCSNYPSPCEPDFDFEISYNVLYDQNVSFNSSSIHIPGDIYEHGKIVPYLCYTHCLICA